MAKFISQGGGNVQQITDDIIKGIQSGAMQVERVDARWDQNNVQRYTLEVVDLQRSAWLSQWAASTVSSLAPPPPKAAIEDLGVITEPIIGYRDFVLGTGHYPHPGIMSRNKAPWPMREPMRAFCRGSAFAKHDAPSLDCECGIYAFSKPDHSSLVNLDVIWGETAMWGDIILCEEGYRAEYAYPKTLFLRDNGTKSIRWLQSVLADGYGVPVLLVEQRSGKTAGEIMGEMLAELTKDTS